MGETKGQKCRSNVCYRKKWMTNEYIISGTNNVHKIKNVLRKQRRTVNTTQKMFTFRSTTFH